MGMDQIIVIIAGLVAIGGVYWFFLMKKEGAVAVKDKVTIIVDGGYTPETISLSLGKKTTITFLRKDPSACLEEVVLSDFKIRKYLPLNQEVSIEITPQQEGAFVFSCGMNMQHGKILVE